VLALVLVAGCNSASRFAPSYLLVPPQPFITAPPIWGPVEAGHWSVGMRVQAIAATPEDPSALQLTVWYPTRESDAATRLHYRDYVGLMGFESEPETPRDEARATQAVTLYEQQLIDLGVPEESTAAWLDTPMTATPHAPPAPGRFPLVLVAQGRHHSAHHQAVLAEYLASHGYVVATTPSPTRAEPPGPLVDVLATARRQARELERALRVLRADARIDTSRVAVIGHSLGARAAFLFALAHPEAGALVSLDGGIGTRRGKEWLKGLPDFQPERVQVPLLHLFQEDDAVVVPDFELLESLRGAHRWMVRIPGMRHVGFTSVGAAATLAPGVVSAETAKAVARGWATTADVTRRFLDATVRRRLVRPTAPPPSASALLTPDADALLEHWEPGQP
jgi:dienelactone hydrolase